MLMSLNAGTSQSRRFFVTHVASLFYDIGFKYECENSQILRRPQDDKYRGAFENIG